MHKVHTFYMSKGGLWSWISPSAVKSDKTSSPLALQSQLLLLILVIYSPGGPKGQNPFRKALFSFTEEGGNTILETIMYLRTYVHSID